MCSCSGTGQLNLATAFGYDDIGNATSVTDPNENTTSFDFDNERRMIQQTDPSPFGFVTNWNYDENGWRIALEKQTGDEANPFQTWQWIYQENGSVKSTIDPANNATTFEYNTNNWLTKRTDAENRVWSYSYDELGRISTVTDPLLQISETRTYTENGLLASLTDANFNTTSYEFDGFDRLDKRIYPDGTFEQNSVYDENGNVLTYVTRAGSDSDPPSPGDIIVSTFDPLNRLDTKQSGTLALQTMTYDLAGRLLNINTPTDPDDPTSGDYGYDYDSAGRLIEQTMPDAKAVGYELDDNGNRTKLIYPDGYYASYFYDELNRLTDIKLNGSSTAAVHFDYDDLSRRTLVTYENGCTCDYAYAINDDLTALNQEFTGSAVNYGYSYNKVHQAIAMSCSNKAFVWTPVASATTVYSAANNLNQYPSVAGTGYSYNKNGCLTGGPFSAAFDVLNRMTQVVLGGTTNDYILDPMNRQARKTSNSAETNFLYDGQQMIAEFDDGDALVNRFIRGNRADEIFIKISGSTKTYLHHDRLRSVIACTDDTGAVLNRYKYGPFGETANLTGTPFGYTGQRYDSEVGLYNYKARIYSPAIGRFFQPDPIGTTGGINLYAYTGNDALNLTDSTGLAAGFGGDYRDDSSPIALTIVQMPSLLAGTLTEEQILTVLLASLLPSNARKVNRHLTERQQAEEIMAYARLEIQNATMRGERLNTVGYLGGELNNALIEFGLTQCEACNGQADTIGSRLIDKYINSFDPNFKDWIVNTRMLPIINAHSWTEVVNTKSGAIITVDPWAGTFEYDPFPMRNIPIWDKK